MDRLSKERRGWNMSRIRGKDTSPEKTVRSLVHGLGYRFRLHRRDLPGQPDIVLPRLRAVIFVHGCYWHRHKGCRYAYTPKTRIEFWQRKFDDNVARDKQALKSLRKRGWRILLAWECQLSNKKALANRVIRFLAESERQADIALRNRENSSGNI
ncbi:MAG: DNA mismatch endonuclease Vsr [candidate division NC10 bacterium]|nr:DNA mismatch endonuclease Vsr [candidate division NC10 bacterium]MDE2320625.1 DNA mismatch endonuclease Vsr [candidate division NC10 bacterium]